MSKTLSPEEAVERARRAQDGRINAIRGLAEARQAVADVREETDRERAELEASITQRIGEAERADVRAYNAAITAGWSESELRKIGFPESEKKARTRRRAATRKTPAAASESSTSANDKDAQTEDNGAE